MIDRVKTITIVTLVTLLVWVFAEAESLQRREIRFDIMFVSDQPGDRAIQVLETPEFRGSVIVGFSGNASSFAAAEALAQSGPLRLSIGNPAIPATPGENLVVMREALRASTLVRGLGLTVERVEPSGVRVRIDEVVTRDVRLGVNAGDAELEGTPEIKPPTVRLTVPRTLEHELIGLTELRARVRPEDLSRLVAGRRETVPSAPVELPQALRDQRAVRVEPASVSVSLTLRTRQSTIELTGVPVLVRLAPGELGRWDISIPEQDRFLAKVRVSGPADLVEQVKRGELRVAAYISLTFDELERGITQKEVSFADLPGLLRVESESRLVRVSIKRRANP